MKDELTRFVEQAPDPAVAKHITREYLQARILSSLQRAGAFAALAFQGGTALRFLYRIPRYSEDLDFSLEGDPRIYDFTRYLQQVKSDLAAEDYAVAIQIKDGTIVHDAKIKFPGLLSELGISTQRDEGLMIKLEVDTRPPAGAGLATTVIRRYLLLNLQHHDRASLLAGKLHAILQRAYAKGRDLYDLVWYLSDPEWPAPNLVMLNNALIQSGWDREPLTQDTWSRIVWERVSQLDWGQVVDDVSPFLIDPSVVELLTLDTLRSLLPE